MAMCPGCGRYQLGPVVDDHVCNPPMERMLEGVMEDDVIVINRACPVSCVERIEELEQELKELRSDFRLECAGHAQCQKEVERLREALERYGRHKPYCAISRKQAESSTILQGAEFYCATFNAYAGIDCTCGLEQAPKKTND